MQPHLSQISAIRADAVGPAPIRVPANGIVVLSGYGLRISVERRHLSIADGVGRQRRTGRLHRATSGLRRLVVIGHTGFVTLEAVRWLHDSGAAFIQIDQDGQLIAAFAPVLTNDVSLRRAQALATTTDAGLEVARQLIADKLLAQQRLLEAHGFESVVGPIVEARRFAERSITADELRWCEATAASVYWNTLASTTVRFVRAELRRVPAHWLTFGSRHSPLTNRPMRAIGPAAAVTSYLYAILQSETSIALLARGLDPAMGLLHSRQRFRANFAYDVMEPVRPAVDEFVLNLIATRVFSVSDFVETREGSCRLAPDFARLLANTAPRWATLVGPVIAAVASELERSPIAAAKSASLGSRSFPGSLHARTLGRSSPQPRTSPEPRCGECGEAISRARYATCLACESRRRELEAPRLGGRKILASLRAAGADPAHGGAARKRRSKIASRRHAEAMAATGAERLTEEQREHFRQELLPRLKGVSLSTLVKATSLSKSHCSFIKRGLRTPHPRHWEGLIRAAETRSE